MATVNPLVTRHERAGALMARYGPEASPGADRAGVGVVQVYESIELEYAAIRKRAAVMDMPHRAVVSVTGADRLGFLNRMITQELKGLSSGRFVRSFWLNRKGRIDADLRVAEIDGQTLLEMDVHAVQRTVEGLAAYVIAEDVVIEDATERWHRLSVHGPRAAALVQSLTDDLSVEPLDTMNEGDVRRISIRHGSDAGAELIVLREDSTGEPGMELFVPVEAAGVVWDAMTAAPPEPDSGPEPIGPRGRPIGWHAYNIARVEAGTALYNIDFGPTSLPHETGVLRDRVSFKKGCYLGQEVVARMESLGHPKQVLVCLLVEDPEPAPPGVHHAASDANERASDSQPETGAAVFRAPTPDATVNAPTSPPPVSTNTDTPIGAVTSSVRAPMLGSRVVCFAMLRWDCARAGTRVQIEAEDERGTARLLAVVQEHLRPWNAQG